MTLTSTRTPALGCWVDARTGIGAAVFKNPMTTAAAIDHLVHHSTILEFAVPSFRSDKARKEPPDKAVVVTKATGKNS